MARYDFNKAKSKWIPGQFIGNDGVVGDWNDGDTSRVRVDNKGLRMFEKNNPLNNRQSGFTFVEVMVAVLAIALLSAIAAPRISLMADSARLSATASKITSLMSAARANSASTGRTCETICYKEKNSCESRCRDNGPDEDELPSKSETIKTCEWSYGSLDFDSKESSNSNETAVTFFPDGSSSGGSMRLSDEHGETILIEVFRATALAYARKAEK